MPTIKPVTPRPVAPAGAGADQNIATRGTFRSRKVKQASTGATPVARSRLPDDPLPKLPSKKAGGLRKVKRAFARVFSTRARASHSKPRESLRASAGETRITARPREENAPTYVNVFQGRQDIPEEEEYVDMSAGAQAGGAARQDDPIYDDPDVLLGRSKAPSGQASAYEEPVRTRSGASDEGEYMDMSAGGAAQQDDPIYDDPDVLLGRSKAPSGQASAGASDEGEYMEMSDAQAGGAARQGDSIYEDPDATLGRVRSPSEQASAYEEPVRTRSGASDEGEYMEMSDAQAGGAARQDDSIATLGRVRSPSEQASAYEEPVRTRSGASDEGEYMEMSDAQAGGAARQGDSIYEDPDATLGRVRSPSEQASAYEEPVRTRSGASDEGEYMEMSDAQAGGAARQDDSIYEDPDATLGRRTMSGASDEREYVDMSGGAQAGGAVRQDDSTYEDPDATLGRRTMSGASDEREYVDMSGGAQAGGAVRQDDSIYEDPDATLGRRTMSGASDEGEYVDMSRGAQAGGAVRQDDSIYEDPDKLTPDTKTKS